MRGTRRLQLERVVQERGATRRMRRVGDLIIACLLLAIAFPLMIFAALAIKCESPGPVFEKRTCIARSRRFQTLKFRTTVHDPAHAILGCRGRTTEIGQILQHTRIASLPQLINVLRGEMSLIDPDGNSPSLLD